MAQLTIWKDGHITGCCPSHAASQFDENSPKLDDLARSVYFSWLMGTCPFCGEKARVEFPDGRIIDYDVIRKEVNEGNLIIPLSGGLFIDNTGLHEKEPDADGRTD